MRALKKEEEKCNEKVKVEQIHNEQKAKLHKKYDSFNKWMDLEK